MKPYIHAKSSAKKYGGRPEEYLDIHQFMDSSKASIADVRHRALLHSSFGCFIVEQLFGIVRKNSIGKEYSPRDIAEDHCMEDLGMIPSVEKWLGNMAIQQWMGGPVKKNDTEKQKFIPMDERSFYDQSGFEEMSDDPSLSRKFKISPGVNLKEIDG